MLCADMPGVARSAWPLHVVPETCPAMTSALGHSNWPQRFSLNLLDTCIFVAL